MQRSTLEAVGLRTRFDIPAGEIFAPSFDYGKYGLGAGDRERIRVLRDFVREYNSEKPLEGDRPVTCGRDAALLMRDTFRTLEHEEMWIVCLSNAFVPLAKVRITSGSVDQTVMDKRAVIRTGLEMNATGVILYHNHISGDPNPSAADVRKTEELKAALNVFDMKLVDHVVISGTGFYSFASESCGRF